MLEHEERELPYLFKMRHTTKVKELVTRMMRQGLLWEDCGDGWQALETTLRLSGWARERRVVLVRESPSSCPPTATPSWDWLAAFPTSSRNTATASPTTRRNPAPSCAWSHGERTDELMGYGQYGRVELTTLTKEFFMPRFLERDEAIRRQPCEKYPWDGVGDVRPFGMMEKKVIEGVY